MKINKRAKNRLFVIEGGDGAGKGTQTDLLIAALEQAGVKTAKFDFPQYGKNPYAIICGEALDGKHGDFRHMSSIFASFPYSLDRRSAQPAIAEAFRKGVVVCNRYTPSNVAYQSTKKKGRAKQEFIDLLEWMEYEDFKLPRPTLVIYLFVPTKIAHRLIEEKAGRDYLKKGQKGKRDQLERDFKYQQDVVKTYIQLVKVRPDWIMINCAPKGELLSREEIHGLIMDVVSKHLG